MATIPLTGSWSAGVCEPTFFEYANLVIPFNRGADLF
jgi:hypothetical protein